MSDFHLPPSIVETAQAAGSALAPAAIGAAVSQAFKRGLTYGERLAQILVGIVVSYFAAGAIVAIFGAQGFVAQAISFAVGMIAYEATPRFIQNAAETVGSLPAVLRSRYLGEAEPTVPPPPWHRRTPPRAHANDNAPEPTSHAEES
jgi:hypothetical protein